MDFLALDLTEKIRTSVRLTFVGVAPAVKDYSAVLVHRMDALEVECLPADLPERITVDISVIKEIGNNIHVRDIPLPENIVVLDDVDDVVIIATVVKEEASDIAAAAVPGAVRKKKKALPRSKFFEVNKKSPSIRWRFFILISQAFSGS